MKIIVAGSRSFSDTNLGFDFCETVLAFLQFYGIFDQRNEIEIISGCASGADEVGIQFAKLHDLSLKKFPAKWNRHGKSAGMIRNLEMSDYAGTDGILIAFWDGKSKGTKQMIQSAHSKGLLIFIERI
jgi:hypothetical protein